MYHVTFPPASNQADWICDFQLQNGETGLPITDLSGLAMSVEVRKRECAPNLTASFENGRITDRGNGIIQWRFTAPDMRELPPDTYDIGITLSRDGITEQELVGLLPIIDGVTRS